MTHGTGTTRSTDLLKVGGGLLVLSLVTALLVRGPISGPPGAGLALAAWLEHASFVLGVLCIGIELHARRR